MSIARSQKMQHYNLTTWKAAVCGLLLAIGNYKLNIFCLDMFNLNEVVVKGITALFVGGMGSVGAVLGKLFIGWLRRQLVKLLKLLFKNKPAST